MERTLGIAQEAFTALLVAVLLGLFARAYLFQAFRIPSASMEENLLPGDYILVNKFIFACGASSWLPGRPVSRGDVVVFKFPQEPTRDFIKRCVGLPGDTIEIRDRRLFVNQQAIDETAYVPPRELGPVVKRVRPRDEFGPITVPPDQYFCLGDNRDNSDDSRYWGTVPRRFIKGRAVLVYWSRGADPRAAPAHTLSLRWQRLLRLIR